MQIKLLLLVTAAGAFGTLARFLTLRLFTDLSPALLPWGTLAVNVVGAFAAGTLFSFSSRHWPVLAPYLPVLLVGFLGAFTTFSTFALETARFLADGAYGRATLNFLLQNGIGITAAAAGLATGRLFS